MFQWCPLLMTGVSRQNPCYIKIIYKLLGIWLDTLPEILYYPNQGFDAKSKVYGATQSLLVVYMGLPESYSRSDQNSFGFTWQF